VQCCSSRWCCSSRGHRVVRDGCCCYSAVVLVGEGVLVSDHAAVHGTRSTSTSS
jgi:hypothetical protein